MALLLCETRNLAKIRLPREPTASKMTAIEAPLENRRSPAQVNALQKARLAQFDGMTDPRYNYSESKPKLSEN
jgi:hypothetical protein